MTTIKEGDRLAVVQDNTFIYTVVRVSGNTGWLDNGQAFKLTRGDATLRSRRKYPTLLRLLSIVLIVICHFSNSIVCSSKELTMTYRGSGRLHT